MKINIRYSVRANSYKFSKLDNGIPFGFCYKEVRNSNSYNFKYDVREEGTRTESRKVVYLEKKPKEITLATQNKLVVVDNTSEIFKTNNPILFYRNFKWNININNGPKMFYRNDNKRDINIFNNPILFYRMSKRNINIVENPLMFYRISKRKVYVANNSVLLYRKNKRNASVLNIVNNLEYNNLKEILIKGLVNNLILYNYKYISKIKSMLCLEKLRKQFIETSYVELFKIPKNIMVKNISELFKVPKNIVVKNGVVKDSIILRKIPKSIIIDKPVFLDENSKDIFVLNDIKYLELYKRWWWLNTTEATDRLIVPMDDYIYNSKQLFNDCYQYLRHNTHPILWGSEWGIDYSIPPSPVSIEIILDLTNIITMLWHYNYVSWNSVTGKEAIQLLMEVIYNWYTMHTSKPNKDYYRAYRWIRWEAEKVYFLAKGDIQNNGAKYVGMLVENLIDYLKLHHFDTVPIQQNIIRMGSIRINNQQGDLIKNLDKEKGKRFYYVETQNFERKKVL